MATKKITKEEFLRAHQIHDKVYVTGMFYSGITIYNQQVRTLNLVYFLTNSTLMAKPGSGVNIVIIGGGVSGLTASLAFKRLGYQVTLLEEKALLLHLQHGCTTRQIHPNLALWPRAESLKPFTELPFANWTAGDAASIEKTLIKEFEEEKAKSAGSLEVVCNVDIKKTKIDLQKCKVDYTALEEDHFIKYDLLLLATGFGLEKYVGKKEITKSYWRNEDFGQLRVKDQIKHFFISGVGDGGVSDVFRLALTGFDPAEMAKAYENVQNEENKLIDRLRTIEAYARNSVRHDYKSEFDDAYEDFSDALHQLIKKRRRSDVEKIILNGKGAIDDIYVKGKMLFINAWTLFILEKQEVFEYHEGPFPDGCGKFIFSHDINEEYHIIVRHGTDRNMDHFKSLNEIFEGKSKEIANLQSKKEYNDFSVFSHWGLEYWTPSKEYAPKRFFVSSALNTFCYIFLKSLEGIIRNFATEAKTGEFTFRMTLHRLLQYSEKHYFQQICSYVGDRTKGDSGRAFPVSEGLVGLAMRMNSCFSLIKKKENKHLFHYNEIFARTLAPDVVSFFLIPIPSLSKQSVLCFYFDSSEKNLAFNASFRKLIYSSLSYFVKYIDSENTESREILKSVPSEATDKETLKNIETHNQEMDFYWQTGHLKTSSNRLIDIYAK